MPDQDVRVSILRMGRVVVISRCIGILIQTTTNMHDLPRTRLASALNPVNCFGQSVEKGHGDHCGRPYFASATPVVAERQLISRSPGSNGFLSACRRGALIRQQGSVHTCSISIPTFRPRGLPTPSLLEPHQSTLHRAITNFVASLRQLCCDLARGEMRKLTQHRL